MTGVIYKKRFNVGLKILIFQIYGYGAFDFITLDLNAPTIFLKTTLLMKTEKRLTLT